MWRRFEGTESVCGWLVTLALLVLLVGGNLCSRGMFLDGLFYSAIARNLAQGVGRFWFPCWNATAWTPFHEHPPLVFGLQAPFFAILGDGLEVERIYGALIIFLTLGLLVAIWKRLQREPQVASAPAWVPLLVWLLFPLNIWSYANNMLDNTMILFDLAAVYLLLLATERDRVLPLVGAAAAIFLAFLCNGPVALSPLIFCLLLAITHRRPFRQQLFPTFVLLSVLLICGLLLATSGDARESLGAYFAGQVLPSLSGRRYLDEPRRFYILGQLGVTFAVPALLATPWLLGAKRASAAASFGALVPAAAARRWVAFFFLLGLATSLPIMLSQKQAARYLLPSLPYFGLAYSLLLDPAVRCLLATIRGGRRSPAWLGGLALLFVLIAAAGTAWQAHRVKNPNSGPIGLVVNLLPDSWQQRWFPVRAGRIRAEAVRIHDVEVIGGAIAAHTTVRVDDTGAEDWSLYGYFERLFHIRLQKGADVDWYLWDSDVEENPPPGYRRVALPTLRYHLLRRAETAGPSGQKGAAGVSSSRQTAGASDC